MTVVVRRAGPADYEAMARLRWEWRAPDGGEAIPEDEFPERFVAWLADHAGAHLGWVAEEGGRVVGIGWLAVVERVPGPDKWRRRAFARPAVPSSSTSVPRAR